MASSGSDSDSDSDLPSPPASPTSPASFPSSDSSSSSHASSSSSSSFSSIMANPSSTITVASLADVLRELGREGTSVQLRFVLATDSSLDDAHKMWPKVRVDGGGESELLYPYHLSNKEEAYRFVLNKLERLHRWKRDVDRKHVEVMEQVNKLKEVIDAGGPGVPGGYEPPSYGSLSAHLDITQVVHEDEMQEHIETVRTFLLQGSPGSPDDKLAANSFESEEKEQMDVARLNVSYLELKAEGLRLLSAHIQQGVTTLEEHFLKQRTYLGAGGAEFVRFVDVPMYPDEAPQEGHPHFYG